MSNISMGLANNTMDDYQSLHIHIGIIRGHANVFLKSLLLLLLLLQKLLSNLDTALSVASC